MATVPVLIVLLLAVNLVHSAVVRSKGDRKGLETKCVTDGVPVVLPSTPIKQGTRLGTLYMYLSIGNDPTWVNPTVVYDRLGVTFLPGTNVSALAVTEKITYYKASKCEGAYLQSYYTVDGREVGLTVWSGGPPVSDVYYDIYAAADFEFTYNCHRQNVETGMCSEPWFYVNTHTRPDKLTKQDKQRIRNTVDAFFNPHCLKFSDFNEYKWDVSLPTCHVAVPPLYSELLRGIKQSLAQQDGSQALKNL